jgi:hypothetical protein
MTMQWGAVRHLFIYRLQARYDSAGWETIYNIVLEFCIRMKLVTLIKMCLNEAYTNFCVGRYV